MPDTSRLATTSLAPPSGPPCWKYLSRHARRGNSHWHGHRGERGFTLIELIVVAAVLSLLVALALPSYLGARKQAAIDEANTMADEWKGLEWGCYLQNGLNLPPCLGNAAIGFDEQPGKYWNWSTSATYSDVITASGGGKALEVTVSWPSTNAGLEDGETFVVDLIISASVNVGQATTSCLPNAC